MFIPAWTFNEERSSIALLGPLEVGEAEVAVALAKALSHAGHAIYFTFVDGDVRMLKIAEATGRHNKQLRALLPPASTRWMKSATSSMKGR